MHFVITWHKYQLYMKDTNDTSSILMKAFSK